MHTLLISQWELDKTGSSEEDQLIIPLRPHEWTHDQSATNHNNIKRFNTKIQFIPLKTPLSTPIRQKYLSACSNGQSRCFISTDELHSTGSSRYFQKHLDESKEKSTSASRKAVHMKNKLGKIGKHSPLTDTDRGKNYSTSLKYQEQREH